MVDLKNIKYCFYSLILIIFTVNIVQARNIIIINHTSHFNMFGDITLEHTSSDSVVDAQTWYDQYIDLLKPMQSVSFPGGSLGGNTDYWNLTIVHKMYGGHALGKESTGWFECSIPNGTSVLTFYIDALPVGSKNGDVHLDSDGSGECDTAIYAKLL